jgi:hypothetical protein
MDRFASVLGAKVGGKADLVHLGLSCGRVYSESMWPSKLAVLKMLGMVADTVPPRVGFDKNYENYIPY